MDIVEQLDLVSTSEIAISVGVTPSNILVRYKKHGLIPAAKIGQEFYFTKEQCELINYPKGHSTYKPLEKVKAGQMEIVEFFLTNKANSNRVIAEYLSISETKVGYMLDAYFKNGYVLAESKMNR